MQVSEGAALLHSGTHWIVLATEACLKKQQRIHEAILIAIKSQVLFPEPVIISYYRLEQSVNYNNTIQDSYDIA